MNDEEKMAQLLENMLSGDATQDFSNPEEFTEAQYLASIANQLSTINVPQLNNETKQNMLNVLLTKQSGQFSATTTPISISRVHWQLLASAAILIVLIATFIGVSLITDDQGESDIAASGSESSSIECKRGLGYWKNNREEWTIDSLVIGNQTYTQAELIDLLNTPPRGGDQSIMLIQDVIIAYLNGGDSAIPELLQQANDLFARYTSKPPLSIKANASEGREMQNLAQSIKSFNGNDEDCEE